MRVVIVIAGLLIVACGVTYTLRFYRNVPDTAESFGAFEVVTHYGAIQEGWEPRRVSRGAAEYYSLRYRGKPFAFDGKSVMFGDGSAHYATMNSAVTFATDTTVVLVNVGDPDNASFFYLVREEQGAPTATYLGPSSGGVSVDWLDPDTFSAAPERDIALHRGRLSGGRWLLLGQDVVLDTRTLRAFPFTQPTNASVNQFKPAIAMSPDEQSFVRFGYASGEDNAPVLIAYNFVAGASDILPIDRATMRFNDWQEIDRGWLEHHFEWHRAAGQADRLTPRPHFTPLPYRGKRSVDEHDRTYREYNLMRVDPAMRDTLEAFIVREFRGTSLPEDAGGSHSVSVGDKTVHVLLHEDQVGLWMERGGDSSLVFAIGDRFDALLRTGVHDRLFLR